MANAKKFSGRYGIYLLGAALAAGLGFLLTLRLGGGLERLSYDLPFRFQRGGGGELVLVSLNPRVKRNLGEPEDASLDRRYHTQLIERLRQDGARLVLFDLINFDEPHPDSAVDRQFIEAARAHGRVVLVAPVVKAEERGVAEDTLIPIVPELQGAVAGWGLANVHADKADSVVRRMFMGSDLAPCAGWVAAKLLDAPVTREATNRLSERWLNYYGPPGTMPMVSFDHALRAGDLPADFFRGKIVVIGFGSDTGIAGKSQDVFPNPFGERRSFGMEIHAQTLLNLLHGDWLERVGSRRELAFILGWGVVCVFGLSGRRPWNAALLALAAGLVLALAAILLQLKQHVWWNWLIPEMQLGFVTIWSVGYQYLHESRRRRQLRRAFGVYLSPYMADRIANSEFDLSLGGKEVEATVMFTDLEGFTKMSESLPPAEVSKILTTYFNQTTRAILEQDGTIIKYIGDAVMAVWGAPLADARHAERAVLAAWGMHCAGKQEVHGRRLRTRIGVNTGMVLAGNLGSDFRFDYTLIGDTTNFASRLEGLNKFLGTDILISEATHAQLGGGIKVRPLGRFLVSGKKTPVGILEVLGPDAEFAADPPWLAQFAEALQQFAKREFNAAERGLREVIAARGADGPAEFYLKEVARVKSQADLPADWDGTVRVDAK